jgi:hypothetical protein
MVTIACRLCCTLPTHHSRLIHIYSSSVTAFSTFYTNSPRPIGKDGFSRQDPAAVIPCGQSSRSHLTSFDG